ncbi:MAG: hypothetical protein IT531_16340 [Burkholderiales bacterium]|nr:hypothetical protein [Burkholderiales bacterium]
MKSIFAAIAAGVTAALAPAAAAQGYPCSCRATRSRCWYGFLGQRGTPKAVVDRVHAGVVQAMASPDIRDRYVNEGADVTVRGPDDFAALLRGELVKWAKVVKDSGVRID